MARSNFTTGDPNTPWWYQTPSLASQSTYSQSTFAGASISQLTDPFSMTPERVPQDDRCSPSEGEDSDDEEHHSFLITTVDTTTGQSSFSLTEGCQRFSDLNQPRMSSSLPRSAQHFSSVASTDKNPSKNSPNKKEATSPFYDLKSSSNKGQWASWRSGKRNEGKTLNNETALQASEVSAVTPTSSNGVVNFTVNCQIHLHSENGELKRSNSNIELIPASGSQIPIMFPGTVSMVTGSNINPGVVVKAEKDPLEMTLHSNITEEDSTDFSAANITGTSEDGRDSLSPLSISSQESQLNHSMSSANQDILNYLRPQLMQYLNPVVIIPLLSQYNLLKGDDLKYLSHPFRTEKEKKKRIIASAPATDFELFVEAISSEKTDSGHVYLARRIREALEKKRSNPFSTSHLNTPPPSPERLSSLRGNSQNINKPSAILMSKERRHSPHSSTTPSPRTPTRVTPRSSASSIANQSSSNIDTNEVPFQPILKTLPSKSKPETSHETSTLPRRFESNLRQDSRGSKPYSSARYTSMSSTQKDINTRRSKLSRHGSFQGTSDGRVQVTPLLRDSNKLSEENSDVLENLTHFKTSVFQFPTTPQEFSYQGMMNENSQVGYSNSHESRFDNPTSGRDSLRRVKKTLDSTPYTTIPEAVSETAESPDAEPPPMPVKQRRSLTRDARKNYSFVSVDRNAPTTIATRQPSQAISQENNEPVMVFSVNRPKHSSLRRENPKQSVPLKRGMSLYGMSDSPSKQFPYDGSYMPSALSPDTVGPAQTREKPPPVPVKQRTHRRTQSYDTSQASVSDFVTFPTPQQPHPSNYKHLSLRRDTTPSRLSSSNVSTISEVPSHIPIISTQDSGITSTFDSKLRSPSEFSLFTDPGSSVSKYVGATASDTGSETLSMKKFEWLQEKVRFKRTPEDILFSSRTHFNQERMLLNSGILYEHGQPKFLVLLTDMLLILKPRKKTSILPGRLGSFFSSSKGPVLDWFSDMECITKMPLMLNHLSVRSLSKRKEPQVLYLHYDDRSEMIQFTLHSVSKEAKDVWVDSLNAAIASCTKALAKTVLSEGNIIRQLPTSPTYTKLTLTIVEANNVAVEVDAKTRNHFCSVQIGDTKCKTPSVKAQCWPSWNYQFEFVDFSLTETVWIEFYTERITSPDEYLGGVDIQMMAVAQRLKVNMSQGVSSLQLKNQHLPLKNGKGTITLHFELGWADTSTNA
ncbi:mucin-2-like isoform X3 [Halichondria panicea]|uniref:mucin-2-like isoform X3 n=1 Tax=Halichondria panicea TaxID=6063 RepID=UPI00312B8000